MTPNPATTISILGIPFFNGQVNDVYEYLNQYGGLLTVPAAPALVNISNDSEYYKSIVNSDIIIPDSGLMVIMWNLFNSNRLSKISGLEFINFFLKKLTFAGHVRLMLVNPSDSEGSINLNYLKQVGINTTLIGSYTAPYYKKNVFDPQLVSKIEEFKPQWIMLNIGGGTQEKLGYYLKNSLSYKPAILCTGAAIAFKTGSQASIPQWADYIYLGWLFRCLHQPKLYIPRYIRGFRLIYLILKFKSKRII
ncbi:UDP-N-acetyl-D-mannosaminuronic acid transferase (WecB/TagA/CpsF family) [Runella defluvii]|uniref:UDP-N-acetyl-D-mannosaminuronic acid transferase (WecB/TagA/CpsF family) n=1 Tax=Runella defluvii TaxID=370973 RepID=A0A7W5ZGK7_9BACT|nr:WecB/TagA/CpsF family glycosyltransferase [Runella defluvii]MBB3836408.1 UDP-N-acetyl-D-mannosaminuronic acid transferase (WecB/TagA/CpsF family) [Runella defluvii]